VREPLNNIRGIIFDLDGTLYVSPSFAAALQKAASDYIAGIQKIESDEAYRLNAETRGPLKEERYEKPTFLLSAANWVVISVTCTPSLKPAYNLKNTW